MVNVIQKLRADFAKRLAEALAFAGLDDSPTTLARHFNLHSEGNVITMHGARRWLLGESIPTQHHLNSLAKMLGVSSAWLLLGQGTMLSGDDYTSRHIGDEKEVMHTYLSLSDAERELVWNLMCMLTRGARRAT